ncbi:hypothetical protein [Burkholderia sp. LMG 32019]|uniref:hypothetical protein n=1 Tax=Burkholderia sp. LMG 32019 TaxID=3158173 RepID=UPI003C2EC7C1
MRKFWGCVVFVLLLAFQCHGAEPKEQRAHWSRRPLDVLLDVAVSEENRRLTQAIDEQSSKY